MNLNTNRWNRLRYGVYAPFYDLAGKRLDRGRRLSIQALELGPGERLLIPGCGTGLDFPHLPPDLFVTAGDLTPAMVRQAQARADRLRLDVDVQLMDAHALELPSDSFDAALLHLVLAVVPDPEATICELARVLRPGGRIGVFDKFLADDVEPSLLRRAAGAVTNFIASDLNRQLGPLAFTAGLRIEREVATFFAGFFRVAVLRKPI